MYLVYDKSRKKYYNGLEWVDHQRDGMKMTMPRAQEILESIMLHVSKGFMSGEYEIQEEIS